MAFNVTQRKVLQYLAQPERSEAGDVMDRLHSWDFFDEGHTEVSARKCLEKFLDSFDTNEEFCNSGVKRAREAFDIWSAKPNFKVGDIVVPSKDMLPVGSVITGTKGPEFSYLKTSDSYYTCSNESKYKEIAFASNYKIVYLPESYTKASK